MKFDYKTEFIHSPQCYKTCNSYCCSGFQNENFSFIKHNFVMLPLLEHEFKEYKKNGCVKGLEEPKNIESFKLKNGHIVRLYWLQCELGGLCQPHQNRPLICKLYPFLPKVNAKGDILGYMPATFFDMIFDKDNHPCTLVRESSHKLQEELNNSLAPLLKEPAYIFAFMVCELLLERLQSMLNNKFGSYLLNKIPKNKTKEYYQNLEISLLLRSNWKNKEFFDKVNEIHDQIAKIWGEFLPKI